MLPIERPLQPAHFLLVAGQLARKVLGDADVPLKDQSISGAARERVATPAERADARLVPAHRARGLTLGRIPDLHFAHARPHRQVRAALSPRDGRYAILRP